ncbi:MAG: hypothetical protein R2844_07690 [Caldilineales bacterium]
MCLQSRRQDGRGRGRRRGGGNGNQDRPGSAGRASQAASGAKGTLKQIGKAIDPREVAGGFAGLTAGEAAGGVVGGAADVGGWTARKRFIMAASQLPVHGWHVGPEAGGGGRQDIKEAAGTQGGRYG